MAVKGKVCVDNELQRRDNQEWTMNFREETIKNGQSTETSNIRNTRNRTLKRCCMNKRSDGKYYPFI